MVKSQPRGTPLSPRALSYQFPECRNSDVPRARHLDPTMSPSPSGLLGSQNPRLQVLAAGNPECRIPDAPDSCHLSLQGFDGPDQIGRSPFAISTCMCFLHSPTPIPRYPMTTNSCLRLRVNLLAIFPRSDDPRDFANLHDYPNR